MIDPVLSGRVFRVWGPGWVAVISEAGGKEVWRAPMRLSPALAWADLEKRAPMDDCSDIRPWSGTWPLPSTEDGEN